MALSSRQRAVLDLERCWWSHASTKKEAIELILGCSTGAYYGVLRRLAHSPEAFSYDPLVVQRVRKRMAKERRTRFEGVSAAAVPYRPIVAQPPKPPRRRPS